MKLSPTQQAVMEIVRERGHVTNAMCVLNHQTGKGRMVTYRTIHALAGKGLLTFTVRQGTDNYIPMRGGRGYRREAVWEVTGYPSVHDTLALVEGIERLAYDGLGHFRPHSLGGGLNPEETFSSIQEKSKEAQIRLLGERHVKALLPSAEHGRPTSRALGRATKALQDIAAWGTWPRSTPLQVQSLNMIGLLARVAFKAIKETEPYVSTQTPEEVT